MTTNFDKRLFIWLFISFVIATVIGTFTHECGHYIVAKILGFDAKISYKSTEWKQSNPNQVVKYSDEFYILIAGPIETMLTGTIGLFFLFFSRKSFNKVMKLSVWQWILVFFSLFWLRQTANLVGSIGLYFITGNLNNHNDEIRLAGLMQLPIWTISILTGVIGSVVLAVVVFIFIPMNQRITFIASGFTGGVAGYVFWLILFGKFLLS